MKKKHPVTSPYKTAVYSDGGFAVLAQVLSRMTGQTYEDSVRTILFEPLGMDNSTFAAPTESGRNNIDRSLLDTPFTSWGLDVPIVYG
jgi:CubicO group peptidase (beta-lactamase class C family)